jgi:hypothetical protein
MKTSRGKLTARISEEEELVDTGDKDSPNDPKDPNTGSRRRYHWIICVGDCRLKFNIWRFIL